MIWRFQHRPHPMEYHGILGGPITCLLISSETDDDDETLFYGQGGYLCRASLRNSEDVVQRYRIMRDCDSLHGMVDDGTALVCFGGRELHRVTKAGDILASKRTRDWILGVSVHHDRLFVGLMHTSIQLRCAKTLTWQHTIATDGIFQTLYCMELFYDDITICAAAGTSHQTILVWGNNRTKELHGHQGAVHAVRWKDHDTIFSASDDRTVRLWNVSTSSLVWTAYGHTARIWDVITVAHGRLASAGEDGTVRLWGVSHGEALHTYRTGACVWRLAHKQDSILLAALNTGGVESLDLRLPQSRTIAIPEDRVIPINPPNEQESLSKKQKKKQMKMTDQVVFGVSIIDETTVLAATRSGSLWKLKVNGSVEDVPWKHEIPADGTCMAVLNQSIAIGTKAGFVQLHSGALYDGTEHRSVHHLEWLDETTLIVFHTIPGTATVWNHSDNHDCLVLRAKVNGIGICCAYKSDSIVVGDTRGNVALFNLSSPSTTANEIEAASVLRKVHGKEHVTNMVWEDTKLYTVGNDGCLVMINVNHWKGEMVRLMSLPLRDFTGLCYIWSVNSKIVVGGYRGNDFAVVGVDDNHEYCRFDTGGRQRYLSLNAPAFSSGDSSDAVTVGVLCRSLKGGNEMDIWQFGATDKGNPSHSRRPLVGNWLHSETIFDACAFSLGKSSFVLVTVSEDCSAKLSLYHHATVAAVHTLPFHTSGIRAVSAATLQNGKTMVVTGGKLELRFYIVHPVDFNESKLELCDTGYARPTDSLDIDHRVNAISTAGADDSQSTCLVVCGSSSGTCYSLEFRDDRSTPMTPFFQDDRPILSTCLVRCGNNFLCLIGTSAGIMKLFQMSLAQGQKEKLLSPLLSIASHSVGVNSIAAVVLSEDNQATSLNVFSGGDDQAVVAHKVVVNVSHDITARLEATSRKENAGSSAIRGVALVDANRFLSIGYDQRLQLWSWDGKRLNLCNTVSSSVGDINCLAVCASGSIAAVCGAGVETFRVY